MVNAGASPNCCAENSFLRIVGAKAWCVETSLGRTKMQDDDKGPLGEESLEAALRAGYGEPSAGPNGSSVLASLARFMGKVPKVLLREEGEAAVPPLRSGADDVRPLLGQGRGNYQIQGEIARGGMGVVLKGHDIDLGRDVAIKVLHAHALERPDAMY